MAAVGTTAGVLVVGGPVVAPTATTPRAYGEGLTRFAGCEQLRQWYVDRALPEVTAYGLGTPVVYDVAFAGAMPLAAAGDTRLGDTAVGAGDTGTNVQETGVDEPDVAKTDGEVVVLLDGQTLVVTDVTGEEPTELSRFALPAGARADELLLVDDRVVVLGSTGWEGDGHTSVTVVDLADPAAPAVVHSERSEGTLVSAREHDGTVRVVTSSTPQLDFVRPTGDRSPAEAEAENRAIVQATSVADWLPTTTGVAEQLACADVHHPDEASGLGTISVTTLDPAQPQDRDATAVTASGSMVYASTDRLYVATSQEAWGGWGGWWEQSSFTREIWPGPGRSRTEVHAFDTAGDTTTYVASGEVDGHVPDRWAFSEHEGRLRVATMIGDSWAPRETRVTVLEESAGRLVDVGEVGGMGENEQIRAVRWFGDVAVLVTFRQTDPLYTVDLSDPTAPEVVGELKIPGFSEYLHPVGGDLLLGVGQDATLTGMTRGVQVSAFDLSELAVPERVAALDLDAAWTPVEQDSRAFTYLPAARLALLTTSGRAGTELRMVRVGSDGSLTEPDRMALPVGNPADVRALPLADGRVAVVAGDAVEVLLAPPA